MKIVLALPTRGTNDVYHELVRFIAEQYKKHDCQLVFGVCSFSAEMAQRQIVNQLPFREFDYVLFMDADVAPPNDALDKLIASGKDIVSVPTWHYDPKNKDMHLNANTGEKAQPGKLPRGYTMKKSGTEEVFSTSFACILISKRVFDVFRDMGEELFQWSPLIESQWQNTPPDNIFYTKCQKLGFKIYVNWDIKGCSHNRNVSMEDETIRNIISNCKVEE